MSAELAARRTAAAAEVAAFQRAVDEWLADKTGALSRPGYSMWAFLFAQHPGPLLQRLEAEAAEATPDPAAAQLAEIRLVLGASDWETSDRQYALGQIDDIVNGDPS